MKKILFLAGLLLISFCASAKAWEESNPTVFFTTSTLNAATTYYVLIDRSNAGTKFGHTLTDATYDTMIYSYDISIGSRTTDVKLGYITAIGASNMTVCWFERAFRDATLSGRDELSRVYDPPLRLDQKRVGNFILPAETDTNILSTSDIQIYDAGNSVNPAVGDVMIKAVGTATTSLVDVKIEYDVVIW